MALIANEAARMGTSDEPGAAAVDRPDHLSHLVHVTLAVYLAPAIAIVCMIGGVSLLVEKASRAARRLAVKATRTDPITLPSTAHPGAEKMMAGDRRRTRVGH